MDRIDQSKFNLNTKEEITLSDVTRARNALWEVVELHERMDCFLREHPEVKAPDDLEAFNEVLSEKDIPMRFAQLRLEADLKRAKSSLLDKN